jgi:hypothetical protein
MFEIFFTLLYVKNITKEISWPELTLVDVPPLVDVPLLVDAHPFVDAPLLVECKFEEERQLDAHPFVDAPLLVECKFEEERQLDAHPFPVPLLNPLPNPFPVRFQFSSRLPRSRQESTTMLSWTITP